MLLTRPAGLQTPARLDLVDINQRQCHHLCTSQYFFILQCLIVIEGKTLRNILIFYILAIFFALYFHEWTKNQLTLDARTWNELTPSNRCLRCSTRKYSSLTYRTKRMVSSDARRRRPSFTVYILISSHIVLSTWINR